MVTLTRSKRRELTNVVSKPKKAILPSINDSLSGATTQAPPTPRTSSFSHTQSIEPVLSYSQQCVEDKRNCNDETTDQMIAYCKTHITKWSESEWNRVLVSGFSLHLESQTYGRLGMMKLIDLLFELISCDRATFSATSLIVQVARFGSNYLYTVCDRILELEGKTTPLSVTTFVAQMVTRLEIRECTGFIVDLLSRRILTDVKIGLSFAQQLVSDPFSIEKFFVIQVCVVHLVRELMNNSDHAETIIGMLGRFAAALSKLMDRFAKVSPALLPALVYPMNDKAKEVKACNLGDCVRDPHLVRPRKNISFFIESNNLFECTVCKNLFRRTCDNCSSCPIQNCCWGCGYRMIASGDDEAITCSTNENLIALFLAISQLKSAEEKKFALIYSLDVAKLDLGINRETMMKSAAMNKEPVFAPSQSFTEEIVYKLLFREKINFLFDLIVKSLVPLLAHPVTASLAGRELRASLASGQQNVTGLPEIVFRQIQEAKEVKTLNALLSFFEQIVLLSPASPIPPNDILELFHIHRTLATTNTKKLIVRIFACISDVNSHQMFLDHLSSELYADWADLFDQWIQILWERRADTAQSVWSIVLTLIANNVFVRDRVGRALSGDQRYELALEECRFGHKFDMVEYLMSFPSGVCSDTLVNEVFHEVLVCDTEENLTSLLGALVCAIQHGPVASCSSQLHTRVYEKLRRLIFLSKHLGVVGAGARGLVVITQAYDFSLDLITEVAKICIDTLSMKHKERAATIRAAVILSSIVEKMNPESIGITMLLEWADSVLESLTDLPTTASAPLVRSLLLNQPLREIVLGKLGEQFFERALKDSPDATIACLASVLESALTDTWISAPVGVASSHIGDRPDQGVKCRILAPVFPLVQTLLMTSFNLESVYNGIRATRAFVQLGIVNPRTVPSILMSRYVLSFHCDERGLLDTQDVNMFAIRGFEPVDPAMLRFTLNSFMACVLDRVSSHGLVSEIYRFVELCFPENHKLVSRDGGKYCLDYCSKQLVDSVANTLREEQVVFLAVVVIIGSIFLDCGVGEAISTLSVPEECAFGVRFTLVMLQQANTESMLDRFGFIEGCVDKFRSGEVEEVEIVKVSETAVSRKRGRQSMGVPGKNKRRKREAEYTSGEESGHEVNN